VNRPRAQALLPLYQPFFSGWRLVYVPGVILARSGHGLSWATALLGLLAVFGGEWLRRRYPGGEAGRLPAPAWVVVLALILLGFFPEEAPVGLILWAGVGLAWGELARAWPAWPQGLLGWGMLALGALLGWAGLRGPGSWLMALLLLPLAWGWQPGRGGRSG